MTIIQIDETALPFDTSPNNYKNSPDNYINNADNYQNSKLNFENSFDNYKNNPGNYENSSAGKRKLVTIDNQLLGYYVFSSDGVMNLYNSSARVAYSPTGGKTESLFFSHGGGWCGTLGTYNGQPAIGMTRNCILTFIQGR